MKQVLVILSILMMLSACDFSVSKQAKNNADNEIAEIAETDNRQFLVEIGDLAPDFTMEMPDGSSVQLSDLRGKVVMLQFTASWCGVCRREMPHIEEQIWQVHKDHPNFALFGIDREEPADKIKMMREATGVTYPIGMDLDGSIFGLYAEKDAGITRNIIIDRDGKIVMLTRLFNEEEFKEMVDLIGSMLN